MKPLIHDEVEAIVGEAAQTTHCSRFDPERLAAFIGVWRNRLEEAVTFHKRDDLVKQAEAVITFAESADPNDLRLFTCASEQTGRIGFLYDTRTREFLQIGERKPYNSEQAAAPNRSAAPSLKSEFPVRGSEG
jgi:hypothetical protein